MSEKTKKKLIGVAAAAMLVIFAVWMFVGGVEHIEDTNGPDNERLTTIMSPDIIERKMGNRGLRISSNDLSSTVKFSSNKFTGVYEVMWTDILFSTGVTLQILDFDVNGGNFQMSVVNDGEIIRVIEPGEDLVELGAIKGEVSLVIAGESADFSFRLFKSDYDSYVHPN